MRKKSHNEYVVDVANINHNLEVLGEYNGSKIKILHRCKTCGYEWMVKPNCILSGRGCPMCYNAIIGHDKRKTHEQYVEEVARINPNIEVIDKYVNSLTHLKHRCKVCGYEWETAPSVIIYAKCGCPRCSGKIKRTQEKYIEELFNINPNIEVVGEYVNANTKIKHRCRIDGHEWDIDPHSTLRGIGCPLCSQKMLNKDTEQYIQEVAIVNPDIEVIGEYINNYTSILHKCKIDGNEWYARPSNILGGTGCPICNTSRGEREVGIYLKEHNINYITQYIFDECKHKKVLPFDFYLPDFNTCIEYDGVQHFKPVDFAGKGDLWALEKLKQTQNNDEIKNKYCQDNGITLLRIRYDEEVEKVLDNFLSRTS